MQKSNFQTFDEFITNEEKLKNDFKDIINQHYGFDIFQSLEAKKKYLEPDLLEFT
jgi:N-formylglutamate deformylase